jgi:hypothetical protein
MSTSWGNSDPGLSTAWLFTTGAGAGWTSCSSSCPIGRATSHVAVVGPSPTGDRCPPVDGSWRETEESAGHGWRELTGVIEQGAVAVGTGVDAELGEAAGQAGGVEGLAGATAGK